MLQEVSGDILLSGAAVIAHGVAPNDNFHQGLALAIREMWPALYKDFRHYCKSCHPEEGGAWLWRGVSGPAVVSLMTQERAKSEGDHPGRASLKHVSHALKELRKLVDREKLTSVALPRLATGVGGLDWSEVKPMIEKHLGDLGVPVFLYSTYHKGVKGEERLPSHGAAL